MNAFEQDLPAAAATRRTTDAIGAAAAPPDPARALPALAGLIRSTLGVLRVALVLLRERRSPDPIHERPRILRPA